MGTRSLTNAKVNAGIAATVVNALSLSGRQASGGQGSATQIADNLSSGVSVNEANRAWEAEFTIASSGTQVIDLYDFGGIDIGAGAGLDLAGQALALEEIVAIAIFNLNTGTTGELEVEPDSTNGWTPIGTHDSSNGGSIKPGGCLLKYNPHEDGFDVTDASSHRLLLTAVGAEITARVVVLGRHDDNESSSSSSVSSSSSSSSSDSSSSDSSASSSSQSSSSS